MRPAPDAPVLVTGCASGIGREIALAFSERGRPVYALDVDAAGLAQLAQRPGMRTIVADVCDAAARESVVAEIEDRHGALGALVNDAGFGIYGPVETIDLDDLRRALETNVLAGIALTQLALPAMRAAGLGRIVLVGSVAGHASMPVLGGYTATKHAATALYDSLRMEVAQFGVDVVQIEPGPVRTPFAEHTLGLFEPDVGRPPGPYRGLTTTQRRLLVAWLRSRPASSSPGQIAAAVVHAVDASRVRARYRPSLVASASVLARRVVPDPLWDATFRFITRM